MKFKCEKEDQILLKFSLIFITIQKISAIEPTYELDPKYFQQGVITLFDFDQKHICMKPGTGVFQKDVSFVKNFENIPQVLLFHRTIDFSKQDLIDYQPYITELTVGTFRINLNCDNNQGLYEVQLNWIAFDSEITSINRQMITHIPTNYIQEEKIMLTKVFSSNLKKCSIFLTGYVYNFVNQSSNDMNMLLSIVQINDDNIQFKMETNQFINLQKYEVSALCFFKDFIEVESGSSSIQLSLILKYSYIQIQKSNQNIPIIFGLIGFSGSVSKNIRIRFQDYTYDNNAHTYSIPAQQWSDSIMNSVTFNYMVIKQAVCNDPNYPILEEKLSCVNNCTDPNGYNCFPCIKSYIEYPRYSKKCLFCPLGVNEDTLTCKDYYIEDNQYVSSCSSGQCIYCSQGSLIDNQCKIGCDSKCKTCFGTKDNSCDTCLPSYYKLAPSTCTSSCNLIGYYLNKNLQQCDKCSPNCITCTDSTSCLKCEDQYYISSTSSCNPCDMNCDLCTGPSANDCIACATNSFQLRKTDQPTKFECLSICPQTHFIFENTKECYRTIEGCQVYKDFDTCSTCESNYYISNDKKTCQLCNQLCNQCKGSTQNDCIRCSDIAYKFQQDYSTAFQCLDQCPQQYFIEPNSRECYRTIDGCSINLDFDTCKDCSKGYFLSNDKKVCNLCNVNCADCFGSNNDQCYSCNDNYFALLDVSQNCSSKCVYSCLTSCPSIGYFEENKFCKTCIPQCDSCKDNLSCDKCTNHYFYNSSTNSCDKCDSSCLECFDNLNTQCVQCAPGFFDLELDIAQQQKTCLQSCPDNYFISNQDCLKCYFTCKNCLGKQKNECTVCKDTYFKYDLNQCIDQCPLGYYADSTRTCIKCMDNCITCQSKDICDLCNDTYYFDGVQCSKCHQFCYTCFGSDNNQCYTCQNAYFKSDDTTCSTGCNTNEFIEKCTCADCELYQSKCSNQRFCQQCLQKPPSQEQQNICSSCIAADFQYQFDNKRCQFCPLGFNNERTDCRKYFYEEKQYVEQCSIGYYLYPNSIVCFTCSEDTYVNESFTKCINCDISCQGCTSYTNKDCKKCAEGYFIFDTNMCIESCPEQYFSMNGECVQCKSNCIKCNNKIDCTFCQVGYLLHNNECTKECPESFYPDYTQQICIGCQDHCKKCENNFNCFECVKNYTLSNSICVNEADLKQELLNLNATQPVLTKEQIQQVSSTVQSASSGFALSAIFGNPQMLLSFIDVLQMLSYILFINIDYPEQVKSFFQAFNDIQLGIMPNPLSKINFQDQIAPIKFQKEEQETSYLKNSFQYLCILSSLLILYIILLLLEKLFINFRWLNTKFTYLRKNLEWGYFLGILQAAYMNISVFSFLQLSNSSCYQLDCYLSFAFSSISVIVLILAIFLTAYIVQYIINTQSISKEFEKQYGIVYTFLKTNNVLQASFQVIMMIRKLLFAFFLVYLQHNPGLQLLIINLLSFIVFMLLLTQSPFKSQLDFMKEVITEFSYMIIHYLSKKLLDVNITKSDKQFIGNLIVYSLITILLIHILIMLISTFYQFKEIIQHIKGYIQKKRNERNLKPLSKQSSQANNSQFNDNKNYNDSLDRDFKQSQDNQSIRNISNFKMDQFNH